MGAAMGVRAGCEKALREISRGASVPTRLRRESAHIAGPIRTALVKSWKPEYQK